MTDRDRWNDAWRRLGLVPPDTYDTVVRHYGEPHRTYHNLRHLHDCLAALDTVDLADDRRGAIEMALWFHDVVYDPKRSDNERRSADLSTEQLLAAGAPAATAEQIHELIMATRHDVTPVDPDARIVVDIDLAILGADPARYDDYERQIRDEYRWVPSWLYRRKRKQVLRRFLERPAIYSTPVFADRYETNARENLRRALASL